MRVNLPILVILLSISGCENHHSDYQAEMKVCDKGEVLGILDAAVTACQNATDIAETHQLSPSLYSQSLYRLGRLKRKQGEFIEADSILRKVLSFEKQQENTDNKRIAATYLELSLSLAGQKKWQEGSGVMKTLIPLISHLPDEDKQIAKNTLNHYVVKLNANKDHDLTDALQQMEEKF